MHLKLFFVPAMTKFRLPAEAADSMVLRLRVYVFGRLQPTKIDSNELSFIFLESSRRSNLGL